MNDVNKQQFYRRANRVMGDWVILTNSKWDLRHTVKRVYAVLHALKLKVAPNKTFIGKISKGFDFLGKRMHPTGMLPSTIALSRFQNKTVRLYEQGASNKRIGQYCRRWLGWAGLSVCGLMVTFAVDAQNACGVRFSRSTTSIGVFSRFLVNPVSSVVGGNQFNDCLSGVAMGSGLMGCYNGDNYLRAIFISVMNHSNTASTCSWVCPGTTCTIRGGDGLPVELLQFTVD